MKTNRTGREAKDLGLRLLVDQEVRQMQPPRQHSKVDQKVPTISSVASSQRALNTMLVLMEVCTVRKFRAVTTARLAGTGIRIVGGATWYFQGLVGKPSLAEFWF